MNEDTHAIPAGRERLVRVLEHTGDVIRISDVAEALDSSRTQASKQLSRWVEQRWLRRIGPGAYVAAPLDMLDTENVLEDPWILVPHLFSPCYIGGWTAAEHWDLTEQLFRDTLVFTSRNTRARQMERQGATFALRHVTENQIFGTQIVWRSNTKVHVADIHRTIVDIVNNPAWGGGIQHVVDCFVCYKTKRDCTPDILLEYMRRLNNGALYKRMGFLAQLIGLHELTRQCREYMTKGYAQLDHQQNCDHLITQWNLWVPQEWKEQFERL